MNSIVTGWIRTVVPGLVAALIGWASSVSWLHALIGDLSPADQAKVTSAAVAASLAVYYTLARVLEERWPQAGLLLGKRTPPTYDSPPVEELEASVTGVAEAVTNADYAEGGVI